MPLREVEPPLYQLMADALRDQIRRRELRPGRQLPTEAKLMDRYGVSRNTVRLALGQLRSEGLVETHQGRGSFVADLSERDGRRRRVVGAGQPDDPLRAVMADVRDVTFAELSATTVPAPQSVARSLGIEPGAEVLARRTVQYDDGVATVSAVTYLRPELVAGRDRSAVAPQRATLGGMLSALGHPIRRLVDDISVRMPSPAEARELQMTSGVPVLCLQRTAHDQCDDPVATVLAIMPGDRHVLRYVDAPTHDAAGRGLHSRPGP